MKKISFLFLILLGGFGIATALPASDTLHVVNWNLEWFADGHTHDAKLQVAGVRALMTAMDADVYALCEVVNPDSLRSVVASLPGYGYVLSTFGSFAADTTSSDWPGAQKLALAYRKSVLRNVRARPMMAHSPTAYISFASGRFPYEVAAEVKGRDGVWRAVNFIVLHAKALTDESSCSRRIDGCRELKDTLDNYEAANRFLILGDFNDDLDVSNCSSYGQSNYAYIVQDSAYYVSLTLPISRAGAFSSDGYSSLIDHVVASDEMARFYVPGSAEVMRSFVKGMFPNYDNDISDHFPVRTRYVMDAAAASVNEAPNVADLRIYPNPASAQLHIDWKGGKSVFIYDLSGRLLKQQTFPAGSILNLSGLSNGLYVLRAEGIDGGIVCRMFQIAP